MPVLTYISHPNVVIDPDVPVPRWPLSEVGRSRMEAFRAQPFVASIERIITSSEQKALDASEILGAHLGIEPEVRPLTGETDRSATGYVPHEEHDRLAALYFAEPEQSHRGWERAVDTRDRVLGAVEDLFDSDLDVAVVGHGGAGTLLYCHLAELAICQSHDQPGQGHYWRYDLRRRAMLHGWRPVDQIEES